MADTRREPPKFTKAEYSAGEVAELFQVHNSTVYDWVRRGWLGHERRGFSPRGRVVFRREHLEEAWARYRRPAQAG